jgi:hypothetical protein
VVKGYLTVFMPVGISIAAVKWLHGDANGHSADWATTEARWIDGHFFNQSAKVKA